MQPQDEQSRQSQFSRRIRLSVVIGLAIGAAIGAVTGEMGVWLAIGVASGMAITLALDVLATRNLPSHTLTPGERYRRQFFTAMTAYVLLILVTSRWLNSLNKSIWRYPVALLPVIPTIFALIAFLQYLNQMDELERRIQFEAFGFSLACTGFLTFALGFLERAGLPPIGMIWVLPMILIFWSIGRVIASKHYR